MAELLKILEKENRNRSEETCTEALYLEEEYVKGLIHETMPNLDIYHVGKVNNNFLEGMYQLTKAEYISRHGFCKELNLLHVTSQENIHSIIKDNLDWRRVTRRAFGSGTYFSTDAMRANGICNPNCGVKRAIIVCKVLVSYSGTFTAQPHTNTIPQHIDTCIDESRNIYVKYNDNEFLPLFVAYYDYKIL
uniref:PARP catalytic domain-containing protein n=1 Tax=Homalodisca liturata TaxID=320908 RepID=A0A1B6INT9_9HEMI